MHWRRSNIDVVAIVSFHEEILSWNADIARAKDQLGIGSLVCWILVLVQMFQHLETTMGIVCIVTTFLCGIGALITFVYGWMKSGEWGIQNIMLAWTGCIVVSLFLQVVAFATGAALMPMLGGWPGSATGQDQESCGW